MLDGEIVVCLVLFSLLLVGVYISVVLYMYPSVGKVYLECEDGKCATSLVTGEKRCNIDGGGGTITYDPSTEVCNSRFACENSLTPYAVQPDEGTDSSGLCYPGTICRCLTKPQCPQAIQVLFHLVNGSTQYNSAGTFQQLKVSATQGTSTASTSLKFSQSNDNYCAIKAYHLNRVSPGACYFNNINDIQIDEIEQCFLGNACIQGQMAFYPKDFDSFVLNNKDTSAVYSVPVACFPSDYTPVNYCPQYTIPVYNKKENRIACINSFV